MTGLSVWVNLTAGSHPARDRAHVEDADKPVRHVTYETTWYLQEYSCELATSGDDGLNAAVAIVPKVYASQGTSHSSHADPGKQACFFANQSTVSSGCDGKVSRGAVRAASHPAAVSFIDPSTPWRTGGKWFP